MNTGFPVFLIFVALFFVAFVAIFFVADKQQKAKLTIFWARLVPLVNGQIENKTLRGRYNDFSMEANVRVNTSEDSDTSYRFELSLKNCVGKSDWTMAFGSELLGQGEWKWRLKSRDSVMAQELERRGAIALVEKSLAAILAQTPETLIEETRRTIVNRADTRRATGLSSERDAANSAWSSDKKSEPNVMFSSQGTPSRLIINEKTMPFLQNMSRWAMYPKIEFDARKGSLLYRATVSADKGLSPEQFQAQLELLVQLAQLNRACNL